MKKQLFWKIMAVLFFAWLCIWLWSQLIIIDKYMIGQAECMFKYNKLTGDTYVYFPLDKEWIKTDQNEETLLERANRLYPKPEDKK